MYNSISYLEIRCCFNKSDLKRFTGALQDRDARRIIMYRNRRYYLTYDSNTDMFSIMNRDGSCIGILVVGLFRFYVSHAPEIGLNLIWGLLAQLNVYPVTSL